jgi:hypothetical protein
MNTLRRGSEGSDGVLGLGYGPQASFLGLTEGLTNKQILLTVSLL